MPSLGYGPYHSPWPPEKHLESVLREGLTTHPHFRALTSSTLRCVLLASVIFRLLQLLRLLLISILSSFAGRPLFLPRVFLSARQHGLGLETGYGFCNFFGPMSSVVLGRGTGFCLPYNLALSGTPSKK